MRESISMRMIRGSLVLVAGALVGCGGSSFDRTAAAAQILVHESPGEPGANVVITDIAISADGKTAIVKFDGTFTRPEWKVYPPCGPNLNHDCYDLTDPRVVEFAASEAAFQKAHPAGETVVVKKGEARFRLFESGWRLE